MSGSEIVRASDSERDAVVERLRTASAEGRLTLEELITRTEAAYNSRTQGELAEVVSDLPERSSSVAPVADKRPRKIFSTFASITRTGWWRAEGTITPTTIFGDIELDLRQAVVPSGEVQIKASAPFGDIEIIVPDGVSVELTGFSVFGRKKVDVRKGNSIGSPPVVRVHAFTIYGSVLVRS
ncbi:DUF1707 SHOCT-like domain-containing protein [Acrocarpospora catenulata]|uniref:DUF1707 SHOCT-like domain-containing protein n=1 Tax=Acrocarpospora catenulata TaxID=2836182 RepID=UPI001BDA98A2|nr:DUF1707 domain-containing protein [Acrocarpospora catenulata]